MSSRLHLAFASFVLLAACERSSSSVAPTSTAKAPSDAASAASPVASASASQAPQPPAAPMFGSIRAVALEDGNACVVETSGKVSCLGDWPINSETPTTMGSQNQGFTTPLVVTALGADVKSVTIAQNRGCAILGDGSVECWGNTHASKNGWSGAIPRSLTAGLALGIEHASDLGLAWNRSCAVRDDRTVLCWGPPLESHGRQAGPADPPKVRALPPVTQISGGQSQLCARTASGTVTCFTKDDGPAETIAGLTDVAEVRVGGEYACARTQKGDVSCWGSNQNGGLGDGTFTAKKGLAKVAVKNAIALDASSTFACALDGDGKVSCWGEEANCNLGSAPKTTCSTVTMNGTTGSFDRKACGPMPIAIHLHATHLAVGSTTGCVWDDAGAAECWGLSPVDRSPTCEPKRL